MIFVAFVVLCGWIAAVFAAIYGFFKYVLGLLGKRAGTHRRHNEPTA